MERKNILYIHGGGDVIGGIEKWLAATIGKHKKYEPYIAVVRRGAVYEHFERTGLSVHDLHGGRIKEVIKTIGAIKECMKIIDRHDIECVIGNGPHAWLYAGIISRITHKKSIFVVHNEIKKSDFSHIIQGASFRIKPTLYVANSRFTQKSVIKYLGDKCYLNYPGADRSIYDEINKNETRMSMSRALGIDPEMKIFLLAGRLQEWKGQDVAIRAFRSMKNRDGAILLIAGDISFRKDEKFKKKLLELARGCENIKFLGERYDIPELMKASDIILHTTRTPEPFGMVVAEGMMAGKPVIATKQGGPMEMIDDGLDGFLVEPYKPEKLASLMDVLSEDAERRLEVGAKAYIKAREKFSAQSSVDNLEKILDEVI
ncbi:MAG: glycosyltransferase [Candidatus Omnitrophica bacterium]|nr:glycosyltransferase [Candidatus Omnitrophota bacterium]